MGATITIENAVKRYGNDTIINGLSLEVKPGEFFMGYHFRGFTHHRSCCPNQPRSTAMQ